MDLLQLVAAVAVVAGAIFGLLSTVGLLRFPDVFTRLHAATKAGVVGAGLILFGLAIVSGDAAVILRSVVAIVFLLLTTPLSAHLLARAAYSSGIQPTNLTKNNEMI